MARLSCPMQDTCHVARVPRGTSYAAHHGFVCRKEGVCPVEQAAEMSIDDSRIDERFEARVRLAELGSEPAVRDLHRVIRHV